MFRGGKASNTNDWEMGTRGEAKTPCRKRKTTISNRLSAVPVNIEAMQKPTMVTRNRRLRPMRSDSVPTSGMKMATAMRYEASTQAISSWVADRAPCMRGSATVAMVVSRTCRLAPSTTPTKINSR